MSGDVISTTVLGPGRARKARYASAWLPALGRAGIGFAVPLGLLVAWSLAGWCNWLPQQILPLPAAVIAALRGGWSDGSLQQDILVSLGRVVKGFAAGAVLGVMTGLAFGLFPRARKLVEPLFVALAQIPVLGWLPILILFTGLGDAPKIIAIAWACFIPVVLNTRQGIRDVPAGFLELGRAIPLGPFSMLSTIILPAAVPQIFTGLREGLANGWQTLVAVELIGSFSGLGYMMAYGRQLFQLDVVLAAVVVIGVIGLALHTLLALLERRLLFWRAPR